MKTGGQVYLIAANEAGPCKIGFAQIAINRLRDLQTGNAQKLFLWGICPCDDAENLEKAVHRRLAQSNMSGEWFGVPVKVAWQAVIFEFMGQGAVAPLPEAEAKEADLARSDPLLQKYEALLAKHEAQKRSNLERVQKHRAVKRAQMQRYRAKKATSP